MHTRRGDLESLMYNGFEWLRLDLPWKGQILKKVILSKTQMKDTILSEGKLSYFPNVPKCEYCFKLSKYSETIL